MTSKEEAHKATALSSAFSPSHLTLLSKSQEREGGREARLSNVMGLEMWTTWHENTYRHINSI